MAFAVFVISSVVSFAHHQKLSPRKSSPLRPFPDRKMCSPGDPTGCRRQPASGRLSPPRRRHQVPFGKRRCHQVGDN